jgi:hypothetical protein
MEMSNRFGLGRHFPGRRLRPMLLTPNPALLTKEINHEQKTDQGRFLEMRT